MWWWEGRRCGGGRVEGVVVGVEDVVVGVEDVVVGVEGMVVGG